MSTRFEQRRALWEAAMRCSIATAADFVGPVPEVAEPSVFRVVADPKLRARLVAVGMAKVVQMPRGRQQFPAIVRLHPNLDAREGEPAPASGGSSTTARLRATVDEMRALLERIEREESALLAGRTSELDRRVRGLREQIPALDGAELEAAVSALRTFMDARAELAVAARRDAFAAIAADDAFAAARFLPLLTPDVRTAASAPPRVATVRSADPVRPPEAVALPEIRVETDERRLAHRAAWRAKLLPVLTGEWQSAATVATTLGEKSSSVLERLKDLVREGVAERRIVKARAKTTHPGKRKVRGHTTILEAQFRARATR